MVVLEVEPCDLNVGEKVIASKSFGYEDGIKNSCVATSLPFC